MAKSELGTVLFNLRRTLMRREEAGLADATLLDRFVSEHDETAFEALLRGHGPMVLGVCRRVLRNDADAEDAFQATFLVLLRKAASIRPRSMVGNWLYGVAHSTALKARAMSTKRTAKESEAAHRSRPEKFTEDWQQLHNLLDQELQGLPAKYRSAIVLCELEGKTIKEAARQLDCPIGTVGTRLSRGRSILAKRLARRGLALSGAGSLATVLLQNARAGNLPAHLLTSTLNTAHAYMAGAAISGSASLKVVTLADGAMKSMFLTKLKLTLTLSLVAGVMASGAATLNFRSLASDGPKDQTIKKELRPAEQPDDAKALQGEWRAFDAEKNGRRIAEDPTDLVISFKGDETSFGGGQKNKFRLDTTKSPREIFITISDGKSKGQVIRGIYSLEKGELTFCEPLGPNSVSPTAFITKAGDGLLLLKLHRAAKDGSDVKKVENVANIKREWTRPDAPPDGNYKLSLVEGLTEFDCCLIKLETKDEKQSASLVDTPEDLQPGTARTVVSPTHVRQIPPKGVPIRLVCTTSKGDMVFEGSFVPGSLEARGCLELYGRGEVLPAILIASDLSKLKFTMHDVPVTPLQKALRLGRKVFALRQNAEWTKNEKQKATLMNQAALAEKEAIAEAGKLLREGFENPGHDPLVFEAALDAARFAGKYHIPAEQLRAMIGKADIIAATYGRRWQREFNARVAGALAPQKDYSALSVEIATRLEGDFVPTDDAATQSRVLKALIAAQSNAGESLTKKMHVRLLAKLEESLDREYRAKVPPFKPDVFAGRKAKSDRTVVLELFTGTQCPPCVAATVAFDALHETYQPTDLVLLQYHLHIPGPDPLANADSQARWDYYGKLSPDEVRGVPTTLFNGKPEAGGGGAMTAAQEKYKEYRQLIDPHLETNGTATLSASAAKLDNKINIKVEVADLEKPGANVRLRLILVEETVRYVGGNKVRLHHNLVRSMIGGAAGFALEAKECKHTAVVDLDVLRKSLTGYLDDYNANWRAFPNSERPLDLANLRLVALVQNDATREILQAKLVEVIEQDKSTTK